MLSFLLFIGCKQDDSQKLSESSPESEKSSNTEEQHKFLTETEPAETNLSENTDISNNYYSENQDTVNTDYSDNIVFNKIRDSIKIGDTIKFGKYKQRADDEESFSILWRVIDKKDNEFLIISESILDAISYNNYYSDNMTWSGCSLRKWLNEDFYNIAFTPTEKDYIKNTVLINNLVKKNEPETQDNVFLLSSDEITRYFTNEAAKKCYASDYAKCNLGINEDYLCRWLTRTSDDSGKLYIVSNDGIMYKDESVYEKLGIRPAMWINIGDKDSSDISGNSINMPFTMKVSLIKDNTVFSAIYCDKIEDISDEHFTVFSEPTITTYFRSLSIAASETINNFKIYRDNCLENKLIYTQDSIQKGNALFLILAFEGDFTAYTFSYTDKDNKEILIHVSESAMDGSLYIEETDYFSFNNEYF